LRQQIEQLQAGRDRLSAAYDVVRETLAVATEELQVALPEARLAAEVVQLQGADEELGATVTPIVTAEDLGEPTIDAAPLPPARNVETPPEPKSAAPKLTVVPPVDDSTPEDQTPSTPGSEATEGADLAVVSEPGDVPIDSEVSTSAAEPTPTAPDPREGRHSSSVRVVRTSSGKAADVFARLRQEGEDETALVDDTPANAAPVEVTAPEDATQVDTESFDEESASQENTSAVETQIESIDADADADQAFIVTRNEAVASIESALARRMKRELSDEQNELLSTLRSIKGNLTAIAFLPTPESQLERYEDIALPALADAAEAGGTISPVKGRSSSRASVGDLAAELASAIVGPLRDRLERAVSESAGDRDDLAQRIRSTFREWKGQRVDDAVSFAVLSACNRGILDRIPKSAQIRWVVAVDDPASPDCEDNALGGPIEHGQEFPTGHKVPPLHPGCHCVVLPSS
jgi:hypothetical protein